MRGRSRRAWNVITSTCQRWRDKRGTYRPAGETIVTRDYEVADIGMRMLIPRELFRGQSFPDSYVIDQGHDGRAFTLETQVLLCGNSVSPLNARALVEANFAGEKAAVA